MKAIAIGVVAAALLSGAALAQNSGAATGAATGAVGGAIVGGPVGAVVGAGVGAIAGGIADADRPRFRTYVEGRKLSSVRVDGDIVVGRELPSTVTYYEAPAEYKVKHRYAVVNNKTVLVEPSTRKIVQIVE